MVRHWRFRLVLITIVALAGALPATVARAGLKDRLKKKIEDKAGAKTDQAVDKTADKVDGGAAKDASDTGAESGAEKPGDAAASADAKVSAVSTKFDFVPGDKVLFADDFTEDELGEFPAHWRLNEGTFETAEMNEPM